MRNTLLSVILSIVLSSLNGQDPDTAFISFISDRNVEELGLFAGYNFNLGVDQSNSHIFELGIKRTYQISPVEPFCKSLYLSNEFIFKDDKIIIGPKIGAYISAMIITLGLESIYYTDFSGNSLRLSPFIGIGGNRGRLTLNFPFSFYRNDFDYISPITLHVSFQYLVLWRKTWGQVYNEKKK